MVYLRKKRVHEFIKVEKLSVSEMAEILGISASLCSHIFAGDKKITFKQFNILVK